MSSNVHLLLIDPQRDFCDPSGSLYVGGAEKDMDRLALMIKRLKGKISDIHVTLDSHHKFDIAHPGYWVDGDGNNPNPFTVIKAEDLRKGLWNVAVPKLYQRTFAYLEALEKSGRYDLMVWPEHCRIMTEGAAVFPSVLDALFDWESTPGRIINKVTKGSNPFTEHYSAIQAEVPDPNDPTTQTNTNLIKVLMSADEILVAGEALSHCLANTVKDIATNFGDDSYIKKLILLTDATSSVTGLEQLGTTFVNDMLARGMRTATTQDYLA